MISRVNELHRYVGKELPIYTPRRFVLGVLLVSLLLMLLFFASATHGAITSFSSREAFDAAFPGAVQETWDEFASGTTFPNGSTVNGITYYSSYGSDRDNNPAGSSAFATRSFVYTTAPNVLGQTPLGYFEARHEMGFAFTAPLTAFGVDLYTSALALTSGDYIATTDLGDAIGSVYDPIPGYTFGQFIGFSSTVPFTSLNISTLVTDPVTGQATAFSLDTLRRVPVTLPEPPPLSLPVPEPATWSLVVLGLAGIRYGAMTKRKRS